MSIRLDLPAPVRRHRGSAGRDQGVVPRLAGARMGSGGRTRPGEHGTRAARDARVNVSRPAPGPAGSRPAQLPPLPRPVLALDGPRATAAASKAAATWYGLGMSADHVGCRPNV